MSDLRFTLDSDFVAGYAHRDPGFGFNGLGLATYYRTYSRLKADNTNERWHETVQRVVEGAYTLQQQHLHSLDIAWDRSKAQRSAREMYDRIFTMKFLPPGRMLWAMGTPIVHERGIGQALFNCAFVSTNDIGNNITESLRPFLFMMDMSMMGVGVGFDVLGAGKLLIHQPDPADTGHYVIPDSRQGWVCSLEKLLHSYFFHHHGIGSVPTVSFDYSLIRPAGSPIRGFGGIASGPAPLREMHEEMRQVLDAHHGRPISITGIADIMNMIGRCVVAGNVRRSAQIALGDPSSDEFLKLKDYHWNAEKLQYEGSGARRSAWGWASNNSVVVNRNSDFSKAAAQTAINGEPGYLFLDNIRAYSRLCDPADYKDHRAMGTNPCGEQTLESYELCCLVETFPSRASSKADFLRTLKYAFLLGKTATLVKTTWPETNTIQERNRRIGTSVSGITNFLSAHPVSTLQEWLEEGYREIQSLDERYARWLHVPRSIKTTSVKPSGTVSLLAGVNPGCHYPEFTWYIRRMRIGKSSALLPLLRAAGLPVSDDVTDTASAVVEFPVRSDGKNLQQVQLKEQVALAVFLQRYWSDNQVSCTATFRPEEKEQIPRLLQKFSDSLKSISFLPRLEHGAYAQMPYEAIPEAEYLQRVAGLKPLDIAELSEDASSEKYCSRDSCALPPESGRISGNEFPSH